MFFAQIYFNQSNILYIKPHDLTKANPKQAANSITNNTLFNTGYKMMPFKSLLTIRNKLIAGFAILTLLIAVTGIFALSEIGLLSSLTVKMYKHPLAVTRAALQADVNIIKMHRSMKDVALAKNDGAMQNAIQKVDKYEALTYKEFEVVTDRILGKEGEALSAETIQIFKEWKPIRDEVIQHMKNGDREAAAAITKQKGAKHVALLDTKMIALVDYANTKGTGFFKKAQTKGDNAIFIMISIIVAAAIIGIVLAYVIGRSIINPVNNLRNTILEIEENSDLTRRIQITSDDEIGSTALMFNNMLEKFEALIQQVYSSASQLATASEQVSSVAQDSASAVEKQRVETDQVATAINEMTATVQEVAQNAQSASGAAASADNEAQSGKAVVNQTADAIAQLATDVDNAANVIHGVEQDSESIGSVLDVIKGIAEQTNLLALNAAIEAARAGEQGRGFAVVADEVRTLASRTQESTTEIEAMIAKLQTGSKQAVEVMEQGREQANKGTEMAKEAAESLDAIARAVTSINEMNTQIAAAAEEQTTVSEDINKSVVNISQISEQTANGAEQTTSASTDLSRLANDLQNLVGQFKIQN